MKIFSILFVVVLIISCMFSLYGCGSTSTFTITSTKTCDHAYVEQTNTATCVKKGTITFVCSKCGDSYKKESQALGHNWIEQSTTATCTESGETTYKCSNCSNNKTEKADALGHQFKYDDICERCSKYKYDISYSQTDKIYGQVLYITFESSGIYVYAKMGITRQYSVSSATLFYKLKDSNGKTIANDLGTVYFTSYLNSRSLAICKKSSLTVGEKYYLEVAV